MLWHAIAIRYDAKNRVQKFNLRVDRPQTLFSDYLAKLPIMAGAVKIEWVPTKGDDDKPADQRTNWDLPAGVVRTLEVVDGEIKSRVPEDEDMHHGGVDESEEAAAQRKDPLAAFRQRTSLAPARRSGGAVIPQAGPVVNVPRAPQPQPATDNDPPADPEHVPAAEEAPPVVQESPASAPPPVS